MKRIYSVILLFLLVSLTIFLMKGCSSRFVSTQEGGKLHPTVNCRMIQHGMGKTCVPTHPQRVVTFYVATLSNALALGIKPIGSTAYYPQEGDPIYLKDKFEGIEKVGFGDQPNFEKILLLKPDLIIGLNSSERAIYSLLSKIAPTVLYNNESHKSWQDYFNFVAEVLGKQDIAQQCWNRYYQRIEELKLNLGERYQNKKNSLISIYRSHLGSWVKNSFAGSILKDIGLQRPASQDVFAPDGYINFSEEELEKVDGDILFITALTDNHKQAFKQLQQKPLWNQLQAVQQNRVYFVEHNTWVGWDFLAANAILDDLSKYLVNTP